ncbi:MULTISPECIES: hypothetical protein [Virgibacillus]|uniref:Uncharacterized protein n=2 Tax=Virgibacillus TaxID=84406 RepID=A0A024QDV0_9BACI|nr:MULTISPECIES: hypothetical protein [Virgibacillus]EQB36428.1 hypothetical protein M948_15465 [Virgibacillus sp. CM-4]MYL42261.1 hypothetical protein [Virgibacillus massiliensis]GGJ43956.1 hypothetical protein GCM10007111_02570 [Virgibacillus kapii]CDQ40126.1 hypothetical protein BN990_02444 [Virgibacillus massiliensis]
MADKKHYFITVDTQDIREFSVPGSGVEYEIIADTSDIEEMKKLFMNKDKYAVNAVEYLAKPFDEWGADDERDGYSEYLVKIYQELYRLGTIETKAKIDELGILK